MRWRGEGGRSKGGTRPVSEGVSAEGGRSSEAHTPQGRHARAQQGFDRGWGRLNRNVVTITYADVRVGGEGVELLGSGVIWVCCRRRIQ